MKRIALLFLAMTLSYPAFAAGTQSVPLVVQQYMKAIKWTSRDFPEKSFNTLTMDYPYQDFRHPEDYLSMNVMKAYGQKRPALFVITLGHRVDPKKGLALYFFRKERGGKFKALDQFSARPAKVDPKYLGFVFPKMEAGRVDIFRHFMHADAVIAVFYDKDGAQHKVMMSYPSDIFEPAYARLK